MPKFAGSVFAALYLSLFSALAFAEVAHNTDTQRSVEQGKLDGVIEGESLIFRNIPYAQAPVGDLRWQPPLAPKPWQGLRPAKQFGYICPQKHYAQYANENCLSLNVSTPMSSQAKEGRALPVMVWIHGGGLVSGAGAAPHYQPGKLNEQGIILVTLNYRLGAMGFFAHPQLPTASSNFGLLDLIAALRWIRNNIKQFGGDPKRVTIAGVSAGGMMVQSLMVSPKAKGLFAAAIAQSGYGNWPLPRNRHAQTLPGSASAEALSVAHAKRAAQAHGMPVNKSLSLEELKRIPAQTFAESLEGFTLPIVDQHTLNEEPGVLFSRAQQHAVPYLTGGASFDGSVFPSAKLPEAAVLDLLGDNETLARKLYESDFRHSETRGVQRIFGDIRYLQSAHHASRQMHKVKRAGYLYLFDYQPDRLERKLPGANHASEVRRFFLEDSPTANTLRQYWVNLVRNHNPNGEGLPYWKSSEGERTNWMVFGEQTRAHEQVLEDKMSLIKRVHQQRVAPLN